MFCLEYYSSQKNYKDVEELKIKYRPADRTLKDFLEQYKDKSIIIDVTETFEDIDAQLLKSLFDAYKNIKIMLDFYNEKHRTRAEEYELPHFFINPITSIDQLWGFLKYEPTDVYICEELGFSLHKIAPLIHKRGVKIRVYPNICQSSFPETPSIKSFFIRPEDIYAYAQFVDVFELVADKERQAVIFRVYKQGKWFGKISELIPSFKGDLDNRYILDTFGYIRIGCGKRCLYKEGSCGLCDRFIDAANTLKENNIVILRSKEKD